MSYKEISRNSLSICLSSSSALSLLAPFSPSTYPSLPPPSSSNPPWASSLSDTPWCVDPLAPPQTSNPITPPRPVKQSAPPWLLAPLASPRTVILTAPPGFLVSPAPPLVSCRSVFAMDFRAFICTLDLQPFSSVGLLLPSGFTSVAPALPWPLVRLDFQVLQCHLASSTPPRSPPSPAPFLSVSPLFCLAAPPRLHRGPSSCYHCLGSLPGSSCP